jgi:7-carboxy-7-deazaguanine synthase
MSPTSAVPARLQELIVAECFGDTQPTFQGEGPSAGTPALFIRLSRCNLTCEWCDTKYTWDWTSYDPAQEAIRRSAGDLAAWALGVGVGLVVITGGEPLLQQQALAPLVRELVRGGKRIEVETNGTVAPAPELLIGGVRFNVSPKLANSRVPEYRRIVPEALDPLAASGQAVFKFVARRTEDLDEVGALVERFGLGPVYVMPEGATAEGLLRTTHNLAEAVSARGWNLTQRLHVLAFGDKRGR